MKYSSTHRLFNTILFGVLTAGFAVLFVFFTILWAPKTLVPSYAKVVDDFDTTKSFAFYSNLGILFTAFLVVSAFGLYFSIKSMLHPNDDKPVTTSYLCYVCYGYVAAVFFALNALWVNKLIGGDEPTFWIILCVLGIIVSMIASNVPMMKILEDDKDNKIVLVLSGSFNAVALSTFVNFIYSLIVVVTSPLNRAFAVTYLTWFSVFAAIATAANVVAILFWKKGGKFTNYANYCTIGSIGVFALIPTLSSIIELVKEDKNIVENVSLMTTSKDQYTFAYSNNVTFAVLSIVTAGIMLLLVAGFVIYTIVDSKKKAA